MLNSYLAFLLNISGKVQSLSNADFRQIGGERLPAARVNTLVST
jgi:hypothetical protein